MMVDRPSVPPSDEIVREAARNAKNFDQFPSEVGVLLP